MISLSISVRGHRCRLVGKEKEKEKDISFHAYKQITISVDPKV
jgi:hypothetical protein